MAGAARGIRSRSVESAPSRPALETGCGTVSSVKRTRLLLLPMPQTLISSDVPTVMAAIRDGDIQEPIKQVLRVIIATGCRPDEAVTMRWADVDRNGHPWSWKILGKDASAFPLPMQIQEIIGGTASRDLGYGGLVFRCEHHEMVDGTLRHCLEGILSGLGLTGGFDDLLAASKDWRRGDGAEGQRGHTLQEWASYAFGK